MTTIPTKRAMHVFHGKLFAVLPEWRERLAAIGLARNTDWKTLTSEDTVSASYNTTNNFRFKLADSSRIFFKRYVYNKVRLKHWLQPSKAAVEAAGFSELRQLGIPTLEVLAYGEQRRYGLLQASFIATLGVPDVIELDRFLARDWHGLPYDRKMTMLAKLLPLLAMQLQTTHNAGFFHWDLKLRNILLQQQEQTNLIWIDCPRSRRMAANDFHGIVTDLAAMARVGCRVLTWGQQMRFLLQYTNQDHNLARRLYRAVAQELKKRPPRPFWHLLSRDDPEFIRNISKQD